AYSVHSPFRMTRKSAPVDPETDAEKVVEAIRVLSGTVDQASQHLELIGDELSRIRDELKWLCNEKSKVFRSINRMPLDPVDPAWSAKLKAMNGPRESIHCCQCDADSPESLAAAVLCGWTDL